MLQARQQVNVNQSENMALGSGSFMRLKAWNIIINAKAELLSSRYTFVFQLPKQKSSNLALLASHSELQWQMYAEHGRHIQQLHPIFLDSTRTPAKTHQSPSPSTEHWR